MKMINKLIALIAVSCALPTAALANPIALAGNAVIIDNSPFYSVGSEDGIGGSNFALNHPNFIDIPYAIFGFGTTTSVSSATLNWNFGTLYGTSGPAQISLYAGNDADGIISTTDRFMGTLVDTFTYSGGEVRNFDVTSFVNAALLSGEFFAVRLEATVSPGTLSGYYGGQFGVPSLDATSGSVPEPASLSLLGFGLAGLGFSRRKKA